MSEPGRDSVRWTATFSERIASSLLAI